VADDPEADDPVEDDPEVVLARRATALADAIESAFVPWLTGAVVGRAAEAGRTGPEVEDVAREGATKAASAALPRLRALLAEDIDAQATTPLALLRGALGPATQVLVDLGVPPVERDDFAERAFPDDRYALAPAAFEDLAPEVRGPGLEWGAAKAFVHLTRRRAEGRR
jgi:hypothetical protein